MKNARVTKREKTRFMKILLIVDFITLILLFAAAYVAYWHGVDMDTWLTLGCGAFSLELVLSAGIRLFKKEPDKAEEPITTTQTGVKKTNG